MPRPTRLRFAPLRFGLLRLTQLRPSGFCLGLMAALFCSAAPALPTAQPFCLAQTDHRPTSGIEPWSENPWYWSYHGQPVLLMGGSDDDNLFQWPAGRLTEQLDRIVAAGGNVVRNTMSDRKDGGWEVHAFARQADGKYDLTTWNPEYWERLDFFLSETASRNVFVQLELWDRFDYTDNRTSDPQRWERHPYNPVNNVNYTAQETGLERRYPQHPGTNAQPFFYSTPDQRNIKPLLAIQQAYVDKVLDHTLKYDHVMYCIDNETSGDPGWAAYWSQWIQDRAHQMGRKVPITEMWDDWDLRSGQHRHTFDHPQRYAYVDVSQNNHNHGQKHWDNFQFVRNHLNPQPRPINTTKIYGADGNKFGHSDQDAIERFWRHLIGGAASVRFHRPDSGLGINDKAIACLRAARRVTAVVPFWNLTPANHQLADRTDNECYAACTSDQTTIILYFPVGQDRSVTWKTEKEPADCKWQVLWIDVDRGVAATQKTVTGNRFSTPPQMGNAVAVIKDQTQPMLPGRRLEIDGRPAFIMQPSDRPANRKQPWVLYAPTLLPDYPDEHERWMLQQLLDAGIAIAGIDVGEAYGSPDCVAATESLYQYLIREQNFDPQVTLLGRSRGGLWAGSWGAEHPDRVLGLAGIYPVFDLTSYPGLENAASAYGRNPETLQEQLAQYNPISKMRSLANLGIPVYLIHGQDDQVVPATSNSLALEALYREAGHGDRITVEMIQGQGHNYWPGFFRSSRLVEFIRTRQTPKPPAGEK